MSSGYSRDRLELTPRMRAVILSAAAGANVVETAGELHVAPSPVKTIRAAACVRLGAPNIVAAVAIYFRDGAQ